MRWWAVRRAAIRSRRSCGRPRSFVCSPGRCARTATGGKVNPDGVYDLKLDEGYASVGIDADTAEFAVNSIRSWWAHLGRQRYPDATILAITADCGGSNGNHTRLWKTELQKLAGQTSLQIRVCHFPPGTSKVEQRAPPVQLSSPATGAGSRSSHAKPSSR
jgi:DDE family transposase